MIKYFISYWIVKNKMPANIILEREEEIKGGEDIREIEKGIAEKINKAVKYNYVSIDEISIINFIKL